MAPVTLTEDQLLGLRSIPPYDYRMASHTNTTQTPATASTDASSQADYFTSSLSSATNSSRNSVELQDGIVAVETPGGTVTAHKTKNRLPPLSRDFPKPTKEIDVEEALSRKPGRWTVRGALAVERPAQVVDEEELKAQRRKALEDTKRELFAASETLKTAMLPPCKDF
ncbi:hypothetical protein LY78DRAFT_629732 [Colletotrichum sublineola]|uniref:Uncharacterized protein n=1 Tax=Colletotrichum sublineola TaxID=1173701 RepID=A0A066WV80_COLSU|nr:hypothetical protein LY78DRAFT_629732 [Colletotrichum sublineola]KDN60582.1 hypothetical protein CSUB01_02081 [Colletotrichum sublineola]